MLGEGETGVGSNRTAVFPLGRVAPSGAVVRFGNGVVDPDQGCAPGLRCAGKPDDNAVDVLGGLGCDVSFQHGPVAGPHVEPGPGPCRGPRLRLHSSRGAVSSGRVRAVLRSAQCSHPSMSSSPTGSSIMGPARSLAQCSMSVAGTRVIGVSNSCPPALSPGPRSSFSHLLQAAAVARITE